MRTNSIFKYRVTLLSQFKSGWGIVILLFGFIGLIYISNIQGYEPHATLTIFLFFFLIQIIPQAIIHQNYYVTNKNDILIYNSDSKKILFSSNDIEHRFSLDDIKQVIKHVPFTRSGRLIINSYTHMVIELNNSDKYIITSLLVPSLKLPIPGEKIIFDKNIFRLARGRSVQIKSSN